MKLKKTKELIHLLSIVFNLSKSHAGRVWDQGGFHFWENGEDLLIRKGKRHWIKIKLTSLNL